MMRGQIFYPLLQFDTLSPYYANTQYREVLDLTQKYMLLLEKNYVSKQLIEPELTLEERSERVLVLCSATAKQLRHKMWWIS